MVWIDRYFWLRLDSPDGNSRRTLKFIHRPNHNSFRGLKLFSYRHYNWPRLEKFLHKLGIFESY